MKTSTSTRPNLAALDDKNAFPPAIFDKIQAVKEAMTGKRVIVAFSGGVDSTVVLALAVAFAKGVTAVHFDSIFNTPGEPESAWEIARLLKVDMRVIKKDPLACDDVLANTPERCYFCKKENFTGALEFAKKLDFDAVIEGSNADDAGDFRPGIKAVKELGLLSPLLSASIGKEEVRFIARTLRLPNAEKPSSPCLATRVAYGIALDGEDIKALAAAEALIKDVFPSIQTVRARLHEGRVVRIEVDTPSLERILSTDGRVLVDIGAKIKKLGFNKVSLDLEGYKSGSLNDLIKSR